MKKISIEIKWAIIFMVVAILWMIFEKLMGWHDENIAQHPIYTNLFAIPATTLTAIALLNKKKKFYHGEMSWKQGFICGFIMTIFIAILNPLAQVIINNIITPTYFTNAINYAVTHGKMAQADAENYFNLKNYIIQGEIGTMILGTVTSAIVAIFTRIKHPKQ